MWGIWFFSVFLYHKNRLLMKGKYISQLMFMMGILLLFQSCELQIMDDRRVLIKGNIVDSSNNPISNISVRCQTQGQILGDAVSDSNGQFQFTSLEASSYYAQNIMVNMKSGSYYYDGSYNFDLIENSNYTAKQYFSNSSKPNATAYNLGQIQLNEAASLDIFFNNISGDNNSVAYKLEYDSAVCQIDLNYNDPENCQVDETYYQQLDINSTNFQTTINSQLGTSVKLIYILNSEPEQTISIPLSNSENTYVFEY